jgi:hypothetical protein
VWVFVSRLTQDPRQRFVEANSTVLQQDAATCAQLKK